MTRGGGARKKTGSDSDEAGSVSRADFATFRQDIGNEIAQLQLAVQGSINDFVDGGGTAGIAGQPVGGGVLGQPLGSTAAAGQPAGGEARSGSRSGCPSPGRRHRSRALLPNPSAGYWARTPVRPGSLTQCRRAVSPWARGGGSGTARPAL